MANFNPPFSSLADKRFPTSDERQQGFDCGAADQELFNGLQYRLEAEIGEVITQAGITQSDDDLTQLYQAIIAHIEAATGGGDPENYLLVSQARSRMLFFPEVQTTDGRITVVTAGAGTVRLPGGITFLHRGIFPVVTAQTDFTVTASKTYHLRWTVADGFVLRDLADSGYNSGGLPEASTAFDSGYDDMLIARIVTNSSNTITITNLANKHVIKQPIYRDYLLYPPGGLDQPAVNAAAFENIQINMARTPMFQMNGFEESSMGGAASAVTGGGADGSETNIIPASINRYTANIFAFSYNDRLGRGGRPRYYATFMAIG